jgi:hypothetical protein
LIGVSQTPDAFDAVVRERRRVSAGGDPEILAQPAREPSHPVVERGPGARARAVVEGRGLGAPADAGFPAHGAAR